VVAILDHPLEAVERQHIEQGAVLVHRRPGPADCLYQLVPIGLPTLAAIIDRLKADVLVDAADVGEGQAFPFTP
jgi:hypothetical protein